MAQQDMYGMFSNVTPEQAQAAYLNQFMVPQNTLAQLNPYQQVAALVGQGAAQAGAGLGRLFGGKTSLEIEQAQMKDIMSQVADVQDPAERLSKAAALFRQRGMEDKAMALEDRSLGLKSKQQDIEMGALGLAEAKSKVASAEREQKRLDNMQTALQGLGQNATDEQIYSVVRQFGKPDEILKQIELRRTKEAELVAKAEIERQKAADKAEAQARDRELKLLLAQMAANTAAGNAGLRNELLQARIDELQAKKTERADKAQASKDLVVAKASNVISAVNDAKKLVSWGTTGTAGGVASLIKGTDAFNLGERLATIKANLGFDALQQMRDASPTGGALGQVAIKELEALQATIASISQGQSADELTKNLNKIEKHYTAYIDAVKGVAPPASTPTASTGGWSIKVKP